MDTEPRHWLTVPADILPITDQTLRDLAPNVRHVAHHRTYATGTGPSPTRLQYLGLHLPAVLVRLVDAEDRLAQIAESIHPCPAPNIPDGCPHGRWPCEFTEAAWLARGHDPAERVAALAVTADALLGEAAGPPDPPPLIDPQDGDIWRDDNLGGVTWYARHDSAGEVELYEPGGTGRVPAAEVRKITTAGMTLVFRDQAGDQ